MSYALPALVGAENKLPADVVNNALNLALGLALSGLGAASKISALNTEVQAMLDLGRDPTEGEWQSLFERHQAAGVRIQAARRPSDLG